MAGRCLRLPSSHLLSPYFLLFPASSSLLSSPILPSSHLPTSRSSLPPAPCLPFSSSHLLSPYFPHLPSRLPNSSLPAGRCQLPQSPPTSHLPTSLFPLFPAYRPLPSSPTSLLPYSPSSLPTGRCLPLPPPYFPLLPACRPLPVAPGAGPLPSSPILPPPYFPISPSSLPAGRCQLPQEPGPCLTYLRRYFYNSERGACELFIYGGCGGNRNRFLSLPQCTTACESQQPATTPIGQSQPLVMSLGNSFHSNVVAVSNTRHSWRQLLNVRKLLKCH